MATESFTLKVRVAWWLTPYMYGVAIISALTGREPDWERVNRWINRAITAKVSSK